MLGTFETTQLPGKRIPDVTFHRLVEDVLPTLADLRSLRAQAYVVLAWAHLWTAGVKNLDALESVAWSASQRLAECHDRSSRPGWSWFESRMTYANAVLPHALFAAAKRWPTEPFLTIATSSFRLLDRATTQDGLFAPVGNQGWYTQGEAKALYDQQPIEAATTAEAALAAHDLLGDEQPLAVFHRALDWFLGQNSLRQPLVDASRCSCFDGLSASGVNRNRGAESTLAYLWSVLLKCEYFNTYATTLRPPCQMPGKKGNPMSDLMYANKKEFNIGQFRNK